MTDSLATAIDEHYARKRQEVDDRRTAALRAMPDDPELDQLAELRATDRPAFDRMPPPDKHRLSAYEARKRAAGTLPPDAA